MTDMIETVAATDEAAAGRAAGRNTITLIAFTAITNLADGVIKVVLPLLATTLTRSPALIAGVAFSLSLPWLLTALHVGVMVDRLDRRRLLVVANTVRLTAVAALLAAAMAHLLALPLLYAVGLVLGVAEVVALTSGAAIIPSAVPRSRLEKANTYVTAAETVCNEFGGPALGGLLVAVGIGVALGATAVTYLAGCALILLLVGSFRVRAVEERRPVNQEIRDGLTFLWSNRLLRTMALMIAMMAGCWSAWLAILPSFAVGRGPMHLSAQSYGLVLSALGAGGLVGAFSTRWVNRLLGRRWALFADLVGTFAMMLVPVLTTSAVLVGAAAFAGGVGGTLWTVNARTIAQTIVPRGMLGRYASAARLLGWGTMPLGAAAAGLIAQALGVRVAFAIGAAGMALLVIPFLRNLTPQALSTATATSPE